MHLNDGQLRAHLDGELGESEARHLAGCPACQTHLAALEAQAQRVGRRLAFLTPQPDDPVPAARLALARFKTRPMQEKETSVFSQLFSKRLGPVWGMAAVVALALASLSFAPVRAWAAEFLGLFRIQQIAILPVDTTRLSTLAGDEALGKQIGQLLSDSLTVTKKPGPPQVVASADQASQVAGFAVRLPGNRADTLQITVQDGAAFQFVVDRGRAQAILNEAGHGDLQLPASLDGAAISVEIPAGVSAAYGDCPDLAASEDEPHPDRLPWGRLRTCVILAQIPSPTVTTPPDLDVAQLAEVGLQFTGMTPQEAHAFSQTVDWSSTLVVPIPRNGHSYRQVSVDGVTGNLIYRESDDGVPPRYTLLWVKNGIVYGLSGFDDPEQGLALANSLR